MQWYQRCFDSLKRSKYLLNVVIIDNASTDDTAEFVKKNYPEFTFIESDKNLGFGGANNLGIKYALEQNADYVFLLNQDTWLVDENTIDELLKIHRANQQFGILSPMHLTADERNIERLLLERLSGFEYYFASDTQLFEDLYFGRLTDVYEINYVNAAAWFIPRKTLETIGGFDPFFFHYGEDDNYLNRLRYHGLKLGICPKQKIVHDNDRPRALYDSREEEVLFRIRYTDINRNYNYKKEILVSLQKTATNLLKLRVARAKKWARELKFLRNNYDALVFSATQNRKKGQNWLWK